MKRLMTFTLAAAVAALAIPVLAQTPGKNPASPAFVDADGDGICDHHLAGGQQQGRGKGKGRGQGPGNGAGNQGVGPRDGSGHGAGTCAGKCDGAGPRGQRRGKGRS